MKRCVVAVVLCTLAAPPVGAQALRSDSAGSASAPAEGSRLNLRAIVHEKAVEIAAFQVPQVPQTPSTTPPRGPSGPEVSGRAKALYFATLGWAVAGSIFNIMETRDALDHRLQARTFPLVWKTTRDPKDKGQVSAIIAGANGGIVGAGAWLFRKGNSPLATFINVLVGGATTVVSLHDRSIIKDCDKNPRKCGG